MATKWQFLTGDVNPAQYGAKWYRQIDKSDVYHVIELINMHDATGDEDQPKYAVDLAEIDLILQADNLDAAMSCCGITDDMITDDNRNVASVEALSSYMGGAPLGQWSGNNYLDLITQAKRESNRLTTDADYYDTQMSRPVNKLGSTAREIQTGDMNSALMRGIESGDKSAWLMGKIQGLSHTDMSTIGPNPWTESIENK